MLASMHNSIGTCAGSQRPTQPRYRFKYVLTEPFVANVGVLLSNMCQRSPCAMANYVRRASALRQPAVVSTVLILARSCRPCSYSFDIHQTVVVQGLGGTPNAACTTTRNEQVRLSSLYCFLQMKETSHGRGSAQ